MSIDGCIAGPNGEMDWMVGMLDDKLIKYENELTESIDTILLGRKMTDVFISYWSDGMTIFKDLNQIQKFNMVKSIAFDSGIVLLHYEARIEAILEAGLAILASTISVNIRTAILFLLGLAITFS